jgi:hypothetical protein
MTMAQTTMIGASLAILIYIAVVATGSLASQDNKDAFTLQSESDAAMRDRIETNLSYIHSSDTNRASSTVLLNGITLRDGEFLILYDSTPYASKGHVALNLPCNADNPRNPLFQVLVGRAPDIAPMPLGYLEQISSAPDMCVYHTQFGFGDPVTDVVVKNVSGEDVSFRGPHSITLTTHESFVPTVPSFKDIQHQQGY